MQCAFVIFAMYLTRSCGNWKERWIIALKHTEMYLTRSCGNWKRAVYNKSMLLHLCILPAAAGIESINYTTIFGLQGCILPAAAGIERIGPLIFKHQPRNVSYPQLRELKDCGNFAGVSTYYVSYPQLRELKELFRWCCFWLRRCILPAAAGIERGGTDVPVRPRRCILPAAAGIETSHSVKSALSETMYLTRSCGNWNVKLLYHFARFHRMYLTRSCGNWNRLADVELTIKERCILPAVAGIETRCGLHKRCFWVMYLTRNCGNWNGLTPLSDRTGLFDVSYPQLRELKLSLAMIITESERTCILPATAGILF